MTKMQDYKELAKQKELELKISDLNQARENILADLGDLGVELGQDRIIKGGRVDSETLEKELKEIRKLQRETKQNLLAQQVEEVLSQAREGSRYVALERRLRENEEVLTKKNLVDLQVEQGFYQRRQLEIFDYLLKHFAQFELMDHADGALPDAGRRFFAQVVAVVKAQLQVLNKKTKTLSNLLSNEEKHLIKLRRQEQRELEKIHAAVGKNLRDDDIGSQALIEDNEQYQDLLAEIRVTQTQNTSIMNQINTVIDQGIEQLESVKETLRSIVGQNQATRGILVELKIGGKSIQVEALEGQIKANLEEFDAQVTEILTTELKRRYDEGEMSKPMKDDFNGLLDEVLDFQEYLGQVMGDSDQVIESNLQDLKRQRWEYGQRVLDFFV